MKKPKIPLAVIILTVILIIGGLIFVLNYNKKEPLKTSQKDLKDSDNDGLKDWEEELYKTDLRNPDTDSDGYLDGEEIDSGTNPLIKAPGDKLTFYPLPLGDKYNVTKKVLNDETLDSILDSYLFQKGEYITDHPEISSPETFSAFTKQSTIQEMARRAMGENYSVILEIAGETVSQIPNLFNIEISDADIKISDDNSPEAINLYLSQLASFLNSDASLLQDQSLSVLESALENQDFSELDRLIKANDTKIEQAKETIVPSSWKEIHKQSLKLTIIIRNIYVSFRDVSKDPLKAYVEIQKLESFLDAWGALKQEAIDLAKTQGIELSL